MRLNRKRLMGGFLAVLPLLAPAPAQAGAKGPDDEALALLREFVRPGADAAALSLKLRPTKADYDAVFDATSAPKVQAAYDPAWDAGALVIKGKPGQTAVLAWGASSEDLQAWRGAAAEHFAGGWKDVAAHLKPGLRIYAFKFVEPGQSLGMAYDGLVRVNGQWRIMPKPWRALR